MNLAPPRGPGESCLGAPLRLNLRGVFFVDSTSSTVVTRIKKGFAASGNPDGDCEES